MSIPRLWTMSVCRIKTDINGLEGDPTRDVRELRKLTTVYRGGVAYDPKALLTQVPKSDVAQTQ
jgi:hypothetical protein